MQARELFLEADADNDGVLDVSEFTQLLRAISPKARALSDAQAMRQAIANERLQQRIAHVSTDAADPRTADAMMQVPSLGSLIAC